MTYTKETLESHLAEEHKITPFSEYLKEIVYGGNDGIVTTFAVVAGFAGAQGTGSISTLPFLTVLLFGLANLFADGASMGLGNFLSLRSEQDVFKSSEKKELYEITHNPEMEKAETIEILMQRGYTKPDAVKMTELYMKNPKYWLEFMMNQELEMINPEGRNALFNGLATFSSFLVFGFIPLIPYIFFRGYDNIFQISAVFTGIALVLLGLLRWRVTRENILRSVGEIVLIGGVSAVIAYLVGSFFRI